ncbi:hypothetical protein PHYPO_G00200420 [Pangasianodon hypophthalmus]|uniref:Uncharacterized protein n=1 Tax=Pangasianodon hypophthalmus TaxID=310915 RepID=A0A5N5PBZ0_PANHP|nr:hypothetical protein PHYPO_G00200420 [Pangasianodon hypophthalmus]
MFKLSLQILSLMEKFKFAQFHMMTDRSVKVYNISVKDKRMGQFAQVTSQPDLNNDEGRTEINCPSTKGPKTHAAKVLLFGGTAKRGQRMKRSASPDAKTLHSMELCSSVTNIGPRIQGFPRQQKSKLRRTLRLLLLKKGP